MDGEMTASFHHMPAGVRVVLVSTEDAAVELAGAAKEAYVAGLDAEWRPPAGRGRRAPPAALIQLALRSERAGDEVYLLDVSGCPELRAQFCAILKGLLRDPGVVKLGFGLASDLHAMSRGLGTDSEGSVAVTYPYIDVRDACGQKVGVGLSRLVEAHLGRPLDKTAQCSDWEARPLSGEQVAYAATDCHCLLEVLDKVCVGGEGAGRGAVAQAGARWGRRLDLNDPTGPKRKPGGGRGGGGGKGGGASGAQPGDGGRGLAPVPLPPPFPPGEAPRFLGDVMLLGLCKQLRMCGIDTECEEGPGGQRSYQRLVARAEREGRVILTADTRFMQGRYTENVYFVRSQGKVNQLQEVLVTLQVDVEGAKLMSRCVHCNGALALDTRPPDELREFAGVPAHVLAEHAEEIWGCERCGHVYWPGVLYRRALTELGTRVSGAEDQRAALGDGSEGRRAGLASRVAAADAGM